MILTAQSPCPEVELLDSRNFHSIDELRSAAESNSNPSLLIVCAEQLPEVLTWLDDKDDVCLHESPQQLVEYRAKCLELGLESMRDPLTGLLTRQRFDQALCRSASQASVDQPVSLIMFDLDHFKSLNDQYGHAAGDEVLCLVAAELKQRCDHSASIGRIGGEEFAVVCPRETDSAMMLADELREQIGECSSDSGASVTISLGIKTTLEPMDGRQLMQHAEQALFSAKANGRNRCVSYRDLEDGCRSAGHDVDVVGLENQARVLAERVASFITMRSRKLISTVRQEADIDGLTQCFNRRCLDRRLENEFENQAAHPLTVAFLDLDHFGRVNKQHGWPTGDKLLVEVCDSIRSHIRSTDWLGRYGGEEFCVVMPGTPRDEAISVLSRLREAVEATGYESTAGEPVHMTLSIGAAVASSTDASHKCVIDRASQQALTAKRSGRNQLCFA